VVGQVDSVQQEYKAPAKKYDGYRYDGAMGLYALSILFVLLVLSAAAFNYHFGANLSVLGLLIITVLYFLLAIIMALLVSALYLGCNELEPLVVRLAPASFTALLR